MKILIISIAACALALSGCGPKADSNNASTGGSATPGGASSSTNSKPADSVGGGERVERPAPTAGQTAALEGGQQVTWDEQGLTWTLPPKWKKVSADTNQLVWTSGDGVNLIVSISNMSADFPTDVSLKATYDQTVNQRKKNGEVDEVRYLELDGLKGVQFRESPPKADDFKRTQWLAYRKYAGQVQLVNLMLSTTKALYDKNSDVIYAILYSTKIVH